MGRAERAVDPEAGPLQRFAWDLRQLRSQAGRPSYRQLAARVHYSASMLSEAAAGQSLPSLAVTLAYAQGCGGDPQEWERRWHQLAAELSKPEAVPDEPPYLGLSTFHTRDADRFFGRRAQVRELLGRLAEGPFLAVFGASGSGKSSLLRAGLLPALSAGEACGHRAAGVVLTPGVEPMQELAAALAARQGVPVAAVHADLRADAGNTALAVRQAVAADPAIDVLVIVVDQFEEVFTLCRDDDTRRHFVDCLLAVAAGCPDRARIILGVRADFYPHCARHPALVAALRNRQVLIGPMDDADLRAVVTGPAERAGYRVEPALVDAVLADVAHQPGALPLVSHALLETWHRRQGRLLTVAGYREAGGVAEAVARTAERVFGELDPARQDIVQDIFLRLTALGEGTEDTRRHVPYAELPSGPEAAEVLDGLARARLVTCDEHTATVAHEVLIRRWPRLRSWLSADRDQLRAHRRLTEATAEWQQHARDDAFLWRGTRLESWQERPVDRLNEAERAFLAAGRRLQEHELRSRRRHVRAAQILLSAAIVVVTVLASVSMVQARRAGRERDMAFSNELAAAAREQLALKPDLSVLLARQALRVRHTSAAEAVLRQATAQSRVRAVLAAGQGQVFGVGYSRDGRLVATSGDNGSVRVWQRDGRGVATGEPRVLTGHRGEVWSPVFSADSRLLAAAGVDGTVTVWDLGGPSPPRVLRGHDGEVWTVAFSPDGRRLAGAGDDGTVRIWDVARGGAPVAVLRGPVRQLGLAYSPDGRSIAAGDGDGVVRVWPATGAGGPRVLRGPATSVESLAFGPDSRALAAASTDGTIRIWRLDRTGEAVVLRGDDSGTAETVAFSPDGRRVAGGGSDGTVRVFNVDGDSDPLVLPGHDGPVWSVAFSPDGAWLASGSGDGSVRFWDPAGPGASRVLPGHTGAVWGVAVAPAGGPVVTAGQDGTVRLWPRESTGPPTVLRGHAGEVNAVAAAPDGTRVASAGTDRTVRVWDVATGRATVLRGHTGEVWEVGFLPDGRRLVSASGDGTVRVWDIATGTDTALNGHEGSVRSVAVSPDGRHLASGGRDGTVRVWDLATGRAETFRGHRGGLVFRVTFSPDGRHVASGGHDGTVRIWDVAGREQPTVLRGHRGGVWSVSYSPDGRLLATSGDDGGLRVWRTTDTAAAVVLRGYGSPVEGVVFGPAPEDLVTVHHDGTLRLSRCDVCGSLDRVRELAERATVRDFTDEEKHTYLHHHS